MENELISIDKLKEIFALSTGDRTVEVTEEEYESIYQEALEKGLEMEQHEEGFSLIFGKLNLKIVSEQEEE